MSSVFSSSLAQQSSDGLPVIFWVIYLAIIVVVVVGLWKVFEKAGQPGWASIIPIYNIVILLKIAEKPLWWIILCFIPFISLIPAIMIPVAVAKNFGKGGGYAVGLIFLPFIFYPLLGFSDAQYQPQGVPEQRGFAVGPQR